MCIFIPQQWESRDTENIKQQVVAVVHSSRWLAPAPVVGALPQICEKQFFASKGRFQRKNLVKSLVIHQTGGRGGHPEPNSIFEEEKKDFSGTT